MIKIGIIGTGSSVAIGKNHLDGITKDGRAVVYAVYNRSIERSKEFVKNNHIDAIVCETPEELCDICDAIDICTPNSTHYPYMKMAIERGKHFIVEKPVAMNAEEVKDIISMKKDDVVGMVAFIYKYSYWVNVLKEYREKYLGKIYTVTSYFGGKRLCNETLPFEWRFDKSISGSGVLNDMFSHVLYCAYYALGVKLTDCNVFKNIFIKERSDGKGGTRLVENDDAAVVSGVGENGELFSSTVSRLGLDEMTLVVTGEGGMIQVSNRTPDKLLYWERPYGQGMAANPTVINIKEVDTFQSRFDKEMHEFISAILGETKDYPNLEEGLYTSLVLDKVNQ